MAVFSKSGHSNVSNSNKTIIANGCNFSGTLFVEHNILIDGSFDGIITAKEDIAIGAQGIVKGEITGNSVVISGYFDGKVKCSCLEIMSGGQVKGKVMTGTFLIDKGGVFVGESLEKGTGEFLAKPEQVKLGIGEKSQQTVHAKTEAALPTDSTDSKSYIHKPLGKKK